jgi:hypothetical protein
MRKVIVVIALATATGAGAQKLTDLAGGVLHLRRG